MTWPTIIYVALILLAIGWDIAKRKIPKAITLTLAAIGLAVGFGAAGGPDVLERAKALVALLALFLVFGLIGGFGGGDIKLAAGIGAWIGLEDLTAFVWPWIVLNTLCGVWATWHGAGYSLKRWWSEQRIGLQGLKVGVLHGHNGYRHPAAISIGTAGLIAAWTILHV